MKSEQDFEIGARRSIATAAFIPWLLVACAKSPVDEASGTGGAAPGSGGTGSAAVVPGTGGRSGAGSGGTAGVVNCPLPCKANGHPIAPGGYYVEGNKVYDDKGQLHVFKGVARPSLEWSAAGERLSSDDYLLMKSWGSNVVRLALNQDFWLQGAAQHNALYPSTVARQIMWAENAGLDVILDLHWSDRGNLAMPAPAGVGNSQQDMADVNSLQFWKEIAEAYKTDGRVIFELYNEPKDISPAIWRDGGQVNGFMAVGMQQLHDAIRATGAQNLVILGGTHWGYDLSGVTVNKVTGYNIMYAAHPYDTGDKQMGDWERAFGFLTGTDPVIFTEFGSLSGVCTTSYTQQVVNYIKSKNLSFTAWAWYVSGCGFPSLITDWNGTPSAAGAIVKQALSN